MTSTYLLATVLILMLLTFVLGQDNFHVQPERELRASCSQKAKCRKNEGTCQRKGTYCPGKSAKGCSRGCSCCLPVPAVEQCTEKDGFCIQTGDHCNGTLELLHNSCTDQCTCCVPVCPEGFLVSHDTVQCFKMFTDKHRTWDEGKSKCHSEGLVTARPSDDVALMLRKDLLYKYGDVGAVWVGARGDGSQMVWRDGTVFRNDSTLLFPGDNRPGGVTNDFCLASLVSSWYLSYQPEKPYIRIPCAYSKQDVYTLCELIKE